jgi:uncharacterized protein
MKHKGIFKPRTNKFVDLLLNQTALTIEGLELFEQYLEKRSSKIAKLVTQKEKETDEVRRILIEELMKTFVTPYDREDIFSLSGGIDDVLDYATTTVDEMEILDVTPTVYMKKMTRLLHDAAVEIKMAIERLQDKHYSVASEHARRAKSIENQVEGLYREALGHLFKETKNVKHVITMLKVREIYRHLSNAADREDSAANVISDIIMKVS